MSADDKRDWTLVDRAYDRGYEKGFADGAQKNRNNGQWNLPECKPKHGEFILVWTEPYTKRMERRCRKRGMLLVRIEGVFLAGKEMESGFGAGEREEIEENGGFPDIVLIGKHEAVDWNYALIWMSAEPPEGFRIMEEENG